MLRGKGGEICEKELGEKGPWKECTVPTEDLLLKNNSCSTQRNAIASLKVFRFDKFIRIICLIEMSVKVE